MSIKAVKIIPSESKQITRLAFRQRFAFAERLAIETAAETDAAVRVIIKDHEAATYIDLSQQDTIYGVNLLVDKSLLTHQRANEVLTNAIQDTERYKG